MWFLVLKTYVFGSISIELGAEVWLKHKVDLQDMADFIRQLTTL
jgi:hypothetical protein